MLVVCRICAIVVSSHFEDGVPQFPVAVAVEAKQLFELEPLLVLRESVIDEVSRHDDARWRVYVSSTDGGRPLCFAVRVFGSTFMMSTANWAFCSPVVVVLSQKYSCHIT